MTDIKKQFPEITVANGVQDTAIMLIYQNGAAETAPLVVAGSGFASVADLTADTALSYTNLAVGDVVVVGYERYIVVDSGTASPDVTTAGGVKLDLIPGGVDLTNVTITGGTIDGVDIGQSNKGRGKFSTLETDYSQAYRNVIHNGEMMIAQHGTSTAVPSTTAADFFACDRFVFIPENLGAYTMTQEADGPDGFANSLKFLVTTADASPAAADYSKLYHNLPGRDLQRFKKGTAAAENMTLTFWVKSNVTGTYQFNLRDLDNARMISATYTVDVSATWEKKTIVIPGDTTGALDNDNAASLQLGWWFDSGTDRTSGTLQTSWTTYAAADTNAGSNVNLADTINNYWQITGVQLELGDKASAFEHMSYDEHLYRCQPYALLLCDFDVDGQTFYNLGYVTASDTARSTLRPPVPFRAIPTIVCPTTTNGYGFGGTSTSGSDNDGPTIVSSVTTKRAVHMDQNIGTAGLTIDDPGSMRVTAAGARVLLIAEF